MFLAADQEALQTFNSIQPNFLLLGDVSLLSISVIGPLWYNCTIICDHLFLRLFKRFFELGLGVGQGLGLGLGIVLGLGLGTGLALGLRVGWVLCITAPSYSN